MATTRTRLRKSLLALLKALRTFWIRLAPQRVDDSTRRASGGQQPATAQRMAAIRAQLQKALSAFLNFLKSLWIRPAPPKVDDSTRRANGGQQAATAPQKEKELPPLIRRGALTVRDWAVFAREDIVEFFLRLKIHVKLSVIVGVSIAIVTLITGTIAVRIQERELRSQTEILGLNIVQSLSADARDPLLLSSFAPLQDYIHSFSMRKIRGLEALFVVDRNGKVIADMELDSMNRRISPQEWDLLASADSARLVETPAYFRFIQRVSVMNPRTHRLVTLGSCSVNFSKAALLAPIEEMRRKIVFMSFGVTCVAIGFVFFISKRLVHVIIVLSDAARRVGGGDYKVAVVTRIKDEVGSLAREFNYMVAQLHEKLEMQKFVSRSTMQMISEKGEATLGGTRRVITAMFTDIRNFTSISESRWPEEIVETLNHYLDLQTRVIHEHHGMVDKLLGDGIMAIFSGDGMVKNAISAALALQKEIGKMNEERKKNEEIVAHVGVGIATGVAVLGSIGSRDRMDYTAIGNTVNLASRLCGIAAPEQILISEDVAKRLNGDFPVKSEGKIPIKGVNEPVKVFEVLYSVKK